MERQKILLTGVTGVLGSALFAELEKIYDVYYLIRDGKKNKRLPRDINISKVMTADITETRCGLSPNNLLFLRNIGIQKFLHISANVSFGVKDGNPEIWNTNYGGTYNALELSRYLGVKEFFFCSTAFAEDCRNPYEKSKTAAESLVKRSGLKYTIFKPSVIVGDSKTGFTPSFNGFYGGISYFLSLARRFRKEFSVFLICDPISTLNFIPLDWVIYTMIALMQKPANNEVYYLAHPDPKPARWILEKSFEILNIQGAKFLDEEVDENEIMELHDNNKKSMRIQRMADAGCNRFRPYLTFERNFPIENVKSALGTVFANPAPITKNYLKMILNYAIDHNFGSTERTPEIKSRNSRLIS